LCQHRPARPSSTLFREPCNNAKRRAGKGET
jgi:hypothetical protein